MHLKAVKLRGFKSFVDPVEVRLEPGVAVVVGPNGSGKSNISDSILWATGSLAPHELRAEKPDDVLFSGSAGHKAVDFCEVELVFDNSDGGFAGLDFEEVSIARRLHRGGEGQYLVNRAAVRRTDVVELLADVGLGPGTGSIVGQGRVEAILASRPDERRSLVEEAAGLGRFKRQRHRAELKLARVAQEVARARDVEAEVAKRLRPLALQATAAERAEKLGAEIASLRAGIAAIDLAELEAQLRAGEKHRSRAVKGRDEVEERLEAVLAQREQAEQALADAAGGREGAASALYRLRSALERLEMRREAGEELVERLAATPPALVDSSLRERAELAASRATALERALAEHEGLPPAARALAEEGERLALDLIEVEPGYERAVAAALGARGAALLAGSAEHGLALLERAVEGGLGSLRVLLPGGGAPASGRLLDHVRPLPGGERLAELLAGVRLVERDRLLEAGEGPAVTLEGLCYDAAAGELWFSGQTAEALLLELEARRRSLASEAEELAAQAAAAKPVAREADPRLAALARRVDAALSAAAAAAARFERALAVRTDAGTSRAGELAAELRRLGGSEAELRRELGETGQSVAAIEIELARVEAEAKEARRRRDEAGGEPVEGERDELAVRLERLERRREALGGVNPLAKEEYAAEKVRLAELSEQRADLEQSLAELEALARDLAETVERRFAETFVAVNEHFGEVAATLFPGGEGRLRLTEPAPDEEEPGIEVELRPAGKRVTRLSLLSGGEKALGAISFLFALFLARPCAFYLLDEVEAALDDTNIGRFVELLRRYADRAQFVVITHQKRTMEAADVLYGVTMGADGVSQVVSRRLPREAVQAA